MNELDTDPRVRCVNCARLRAGCCQSPRAAGLACVNGRAEISPALANLPQWCPAFVARVAA